MGKVPLFRGQVISLPLDSVSLLAKGVHLNYLAASWGNNED